MRPKPASSFQYEKLIRVCQTLISVALSTPPPSPSQIIANASVAHYWSAVWTQTWPRLFRSPSTVMAMSVLLFGAPCLSVIKYVLMDSKGFFNFLLWVYVGHSSKLAVTDLFSMLREWSSLLGIYHSGAMFLQMLNSLWWSTDSSSWHWHWQEMYT